MLDVEDVEDVACTVDDMDAMNRSRSLVRGDGVREGEGGGTRVSYEERCTSRLCITALFVPGSTRSAEKNPNGIGRTK
jgi:hypothetical protein